MLEEYASEEGSLCNVVGAVWRCYGSAMVVQNAPHEGSLCNVVVAVWWCYGSAMVAHNTARAASPGRVLLPVCALSANPIAVPIPA